MEQNLLKIITDRWGLPAGCPVDSSASEACSDSRGDSGRSETTLKVTLVVAGGFGDQEALEQASLSSEKLRGIGWENNLFHMKTGLALGRLTSPGCRMVWYRLIKAIPGSDLIHLMVESRSGFWLTGLPLIIIARFFSRPILLQLVGNSFHSADAFTRWLMKPWLRQVTQTLVQPGAVPLLDESVRSSLMPIKPVVDLDRVERRHLSSVQPKLLVDGREGSIGMIQSTLAGFRLAKRKYPRCEMTLWLGRKQRAQLVALVGQSKLNDIELISPITPSEIRRYLDQSEIFVDLSGTAHLSTAFTRAAASGRVMVTRQGSALTRTLLSDFQFVPLEFKISTGLANLAIDLVEDKSMVSSCSDRALALAEQFAWDNVESQWLTLYSQVARLRPGRVSKLTPTDATTIFSGLS